jgi:stage II sporulation protein D
MKKIVFLLLIFAEHGLSQKINAGLYFEHVVKKINFSSNTGSYMIYCDSSFIGECKLDESILITAQENSMKLSMGDRIILTKKAVFIPNKYQDYFQIKPLIPELKSRVYEGELHIETTKNNNLKIINYIPLNDYLEGVVESEAGVGQTFEYYKVQSIISRTYALKNWQRHEKEGFNLCDQVHCQAYLHKRNAAKNLVDSAVVTTNNKVLIHQDTSYAPTFFHANCGGEISNPEMVWNTSIEGLSSFKDPFCTHTKQATWKKTIPLEKWSSFFSKTYNFPIQDSAHFYWMTNFSQESRLSFFIHPIFGIPLRDIREQFRLKSTFFSVSLIENNIVLSGRGFGHGVGLCQEGAMNMAKQGYRAEDILNYYFPSSRLESVSFIRE